MILGTLQRERLTALIDSEIKNALCPTVPKYQSFSDMHTKYADVEEIQTLLAAVVLQSATIFNAKLKVQACWFNILKEDSPFTTSYHKHNCDVVCIYYLKNCYGNGTFVIVDEIEQQLSCTDDTFQFMFGSLSHSIPLFNGKDRYSIAFNLNAQ